MLPYQSQTVDTFMKLLPPGAGDILELGSDMGGEVACALAQRTGARVVGINPAPEFPQLVNPGVPNVCFLRMDGRSLPFPDSSFDAVLSVATMEHVNGLDLFLAEVARVLKPKGVFFTEFCPLWSSARGHHVFAVAGSKEARFWKPGKNPIPDYAHLLWTPDEMRAYLQSGPCTEELIEPIIRWVYFGDDINRCHFEQYLEAFDRSPLMLQELRLGHDNPDPETLARLLESYGPRRNFRCSQISAAFRKAPEGNAEALLFGAYLAVGRRLRSFAARQRQRIRFVLSLLFR